MKCFGICVRDCGIERWKAQGEERLNNALDEQFLIGKMG